MSDHAKPPSAEHAKGSVEKGSVKKALGKLIGDARLEAEGKAQKPGAPKAASRRG